MPNDSSTPTIRPTLDAFATFPAWCIPALAAWQGPCYSWMHPRNFEGAGVEADPDNEGHVRLTACDGSNFLCLRVRGTCGEPFDFLLPDGLVGACSASKPVRMFIEGDWVEVARPAWMHPKTVLLSGAKYAPAHSAIDDLMAFVQPEEPPDEESEEYSLWAGAVGFSERFSEWPLQAIEAEPSEGAMEIPGPALAKLAALAGDDRPGFDNGFHVTKRCLEKVDAYYWDLGMSFAVTMAATP